jgi:hypothetical protein
MAWQVLVSGQELNTMKAFRSLTVLAAALSFVSIASFAQRERTASSRPAKPQVSDRVGPNSKLAQHLQEQELLPAGVSSFSAAAEGFKKLGDFVAALHVYKNLDLSNANPPVTWATFAEACQKGLDKALKQLVPSADRKFEVDRARTAAADDLSEAKADEEIDKNDS